MPSFEATALFLVVPLGALALTATAVVGSFFGLRGQDPPMAPAGSQGRILVYLSAAGTIPIFGLVMWLQVASIETRGPLSPQDSNVVLWTGRMWGWVSAIAIAVQGWIVRKRLLDFVGPNFGRVLVLAMPPLTSVVFYLVLGLQVFGRLPLASTVSEPRVGAVVSALVLYGLGSLVLPAVTTVANRVNDLASFRNFRRLLVLSDVGILPVFVGLVWALLQIRSL